MRLRRPRRSLVLHQVDLFDLERLHEALSLGVVVGVAAPAHRAPQAVLLEFGTVVLGSMLRGLDRNGGCSPWAAAGWRWPHDRLSHATPLRAIVATTKAMLGQP